MAVYLSTEPGSIHHPPRIIDPHYGVGLDAANLYHPPSSHHLWRCPGGYLRPWISASSNLDIGSTISLDADKFQANLDVHQFKPGELIVKVIGDNAVTIEGKHDEKEDEHGIISRHFLRRYKIPKTCDINQIETKLSSDGILTIFVPQIAAGDKGSRTVPIIQTGQPAKAIKDKKKVENGTTENEKFFQLE